MSNAAKIAMAGDWGSGTREAEKVGEQISRYSPDVTIHLGDVYYTGNPQEIKENFLGEKVSEFDPTSWPRGTQRTFSLLGNHEMFARGIPYFETLLPALGQKASYFCLENDYWRIVALDTGYNSTGLDFGPFKPSCRIPDEVLVWLASLNLEADGRGTILLSHHQPWSAFERGYATPAKQLARFIDWPVLWFWGHEHRMAVYEKYSQGITAWGYCIGHGGMPVEVKAPNPKPQVRFTDMREYPNSEGLKVGYNGYTTLDFDGPVLTMTFRDLNGFLVHVENWVMKSPPAIGSRQDV